MPIPESTLSKVESSSGWDCLQPGHVPIREALDDYKWPSEIKFQVFLQGSYKSDTNLGGDSDVDLVVRLVISHNRNDSC